MKDGAPTSGREDEPVYLGLGSNLPGFSGGRRANLRMSLELLSKLPGMDLRMLSSFYETEPLGPRGQDRYINAAAEIRTASGPEELLEELQAIEAAMGRVRRKRWGARTIDLDILLWGERMIETERLTVPHPEMARRGFVLVPLAEIAPGRIHPPSGRTIKELLDKVSTQGVRRVEEAD
jgi:2-amino-4-hydroxy-6-hydroxymethyldihydropteridine diphosphokinase